MPAYKSDNKEMLHLILEEKLPALEQLWYEVLNRHEDHKVTYLRPFGIESLHRMYGTMIVRTRYAMRRIEDYLYGRVENLPELEEPRFFQPPAAWGVGFSQLIGF